MNYALGIDIGGTNFRIGIVDENGVLTGFEKKSSSIFNDNNAVYALKAEISNYLMNMRMLDQISSIAIGVPSMVSKDKKTVYSTPNLKGLDNINLGDPLSEFFGIPVFVDRDVNFLLQSDISSLNLDKDKTILGFYIGTGLGNALYINGQLHCGKNGAAGELGHIPFIDLNEVCTCGNTGCAELRCSGRRLEHLVEQNFPDTKISDIFKEHSNHPIIQKYVKDLAIPIASEINIIDPDYIILAGGVIYMENFPIDLLVESIHFFTRKPYPEKNLDIRFSRHTQQSGVIGSGTFALNSVNKITV
jgi:allose kinase